MLERLLPKIGAPQFDLPSSLFRQSAPPLDTTHLTNARDVFPEPPRTPPSPPDPRPHIRRLMDAPDSPERVELIVAYNDLCDRIDAFLAGAKEDRRADLEAKRADLYARCREAEDDLKALDQAIATTNTRNNSLGSRLSEVRAKALEAAQPTYDTRFPSADEVSKFNERRAAAQAEVKKAEAEWTETSRELQLLENHQRPAAAKALRDLTEQLAAVDREIQGL